MPTNKIGGYRFIPIDTNTIKAPIAFDELRLDRPHRQGSVSGTINVTWRAETPICVGQGPKDDVRPMMVGGSPVIPGATLKGMIRSVLEIATASALGAIDAHRHYGFRHIGANHPRPKGNEVYAGWLTRELVKGEGLQRWVFRKAGGDGSYFRFPFTDLVDGAGFSSTGDWKASNTKEKIQWLSENSNDWLRMVRAKYDGRSKIYPGGDLGKAIRPDASGTHTGYLVLGGACPEDNIKANEHLFPAPKKGDGFILRDDVVELFSQMHSDPGRDRPKPRGAWRFWLLQMGYSEENDLFGFTPLNGEEKIQGYSTPGIPVFYHGDPANAVDQTTDPAGELNFCFGLSRILRFPYHLSFGHVAANTIAPSGNEVGFENNGTSEVNIYTVPKLEDQDAFDFARAMFGDLDQAVVPPGASEQEAEKIKEAAKALSSRVHFSCAFSDEPARLTNPMTTIFGQPRPSFAAAYLQDGGDAPYDSPHSRLSGRKRYPARNTAFAPTADRGPTTSTVRFLKAGTQFTSQIRFHNLHPAELGALLWALTFGEPGGRFRHSCGRAKGFGYGSLAADVSLHRLRAVNGASSDDSLEQWLEIFETFMLERRKNTEDNFTQIPEIICLRNMADPGFGEQYLQNLAYAEIGDFKHLQQQGLGHVLDDERWDEDT